MLTRDFVSPSQPLRVPFGAGALRHLGSETDAISRTRALIRSTQFQRDDAEALSAGVGITTAGVFAEPWMHTPVEVTARSPEVLAGSGADCLVSCGGGSTIGLGKAKAWRKDALTLVVASTFAGSEVTDRPGKTEAQVKTTCQNPRIRPEAAIQDPGLTLGRPLAMSEASGLYAIGHAVEGLCATNANPVTSMMAVEGIAVLQQALPGICPDPADLSVRGDALFASRLCGTVFGETLDLPHAETHAILVPHTVAFNTVAATALQPAAQLFGGDLGGGLYDLARSFGASGALRDLGVSQHDLTRIADRAIKTPNANPREVTRDAMLALLEAAWAGA